MCPALESTWQGIIHNYAGAKIVKISNSSYILRDKEMPNMFLDNIFPIHFQGYSFLGQKFVKM